MTRARLPSMAVTALCAILAAGDGIAQSRVLGQPAPDCTLAALGDGPGYDLRQFRGKVVYVDFWASWCTTCVAAFPFLNALEHDFGGRGLAVLGINVDQKPKDAAAFLARYPAHFSVAADSAGTCPRSFDVQAMPSSYLIDRLGVVRYRHMGFRSGNAEAIRREVALLLAEPEPPR